MKISTLIAIPNIACAFSEKSNGPMKPGWQGSKKNRKAFAEKLGLDRRAVIVPVFGTRTYHLEKIPGPEAVLSGYDAIVTRLRGVALMATFADCVPLYFTDIKTGWIGLVHISRHNILQGLVEKVVDFFKEYRSNPQDIHVGIGPHICIQHYEIQEDVAQQFKNRYQQAIQKQDNRLFLNLQNILLKQFADTGIPKSNITTSHICTVEDPKLYSYRRDFYEQKRFPTAAALIGLKIVFKA